MVENEEVGYWRGKCEVYEHMITDYRNMSMMLIDHIRQSAIASKQPDILSQFIGSFMNNPGYQDYMKRAAEDEAKKFGSEHPDFRPSI